MLLVLLSFEHRGWILDSYPTNYDYGATIKGIKEFLIAHLKDVKVDHIEYLKVMIENVLQQMFTVQVPFIKYIRNYRLLDNRMDMTVVYMPFTI